jgi:hypothetical protein
MSYPGSQDLTRKPTYNHFRGAVQLAASVSMAVGCFAVALGFGTHAWNYLELQAHGREHIKDG